MGLKVAILGSFRKHFNQISEARDRFIEAGFEVVLPVGEITDPNPGFVPLSSDKPGLMPAEIEALAVEKALNAEVIFFVCPKGYIGRTASYELGRLTQAGKRLFFSEAPDDMPVSIMPESVVPVEALITGLKDGTISL